MPVKWVSAAGDELLVMQNRSFGWGSTMESKMDILAWNLTADSMEWYRNLDGFSSTARPAIEGDKVYFYGDHHAYCINPATGDTRWKYFIGDGPEDDFNTANIIIVKDKLIVKPDNRHMHAVNKHTGSLIWINEEVVSMPYMLTERNDTIWLANAGVFGIDANTGEKVIDDWKGSRSGSWIFPIAFHPTNGLIYTTDGDFLYCLDPKYMKKP
jgi:outer membrane protein assembly factor BamB